MVIAVFCLSKPIGVTLLVDHRGSTFVITVVIISIIISLGSSISREITERCNTGSEYELCPLFEASVLS